MAAPSVLAACGRRESTDDPQAGAADASAPPVREAGSPPGVEPIVRVRVRQRRRGAAPLRIGGDATWLELRRPGAARSDEPASSARRVVLPGPITVTTSARGWSILDGRGFRPTVRGRETLELRPVDEHGVPARGEGVIGVDEDAYPGFLRLVARSGASDRRYDVVNHVPVERYLPRVLTGELYSHWHEETFAAQAIAARSFAAAEHAHWSRRHYDVVNDAGSQMYEGTGAHARARDAAAATRGVFLSHGGGLVPGYYSSCCGGVAAEAVDAISTNAINVVPPLRGRAGPDVCTDAALFRWTITRPARDVTARLAAFGRRANNDRLAGIADIRAIEIAARNPHGRPRAFRITADGGTSIELEAETLRRAVDTSVDGVPRSGPLLWSSNVSVGVEGDTVRFDGAGHGHGVGMCQYGAEELARAGSPHEAILRWYYPDVELTQAYA